MLCIGPCVLFTLHLKKAMCTKEEEHTDGERKVGIPVPSNREGSGKTHNQLIGDSEGPWAQLWYTFRTGHGPFSRPHESLGLDPIAWRIRPFHQQVQVIGAIQNIGSGGFVEQWTGAD